METVVGWQPSPERPPIDIGAVLFETTDLIGSRPGAIFAIALLAVLPGQLAQLALSHYRPTPTAFADLPLLLGFTAFVSFLAAIGSLFGEGALIGVVLARHDQAGGFWNALSCAILRIPLFILLAILYLVGVLIGLAVIVVPGVILACMWSVIGPIATAEKTGPLATLRRSYQLTAGTIWKIFLLLLVTQTGLWIFSWTSRHLLSLVADGTIADPSYVPGPVPFLILTTIAVVIAAFHLALICSLYVALLDRDGGRPTDRLEQIFE